MSLESVLPDAVRKSYLRKFAALTVVVLLAVSAVGVYTTVAVSSEVEEDAHRDVESAAALEATQLEMWLDTNEERVRAISTSGKFQTDNTGLASVELQRQKALYDDVHALHLVDLESGAIVESTNDDVEGWLFDSFGVVWARGGLAFDDSSSVSVTDVHTQNGEAVVAFVSPVGGTSYAVALSVRVDAISASFTDRVEGSYTGVVADNGITQFSSLDNRHDYSLDDERAVDRASAGEQGAVEVSSDGGTEVVGYADVEGVDWVLAYHVPADSAYSVLGQVQRDIAALVGVTLVGFLLVGLTIGRSTVRNLRELSERATALADGDLDASVERSDRIDEIGAVDDGFAAIDDYVTRVADQADALAEQRFDDPVLEAEVPGDLGRSLDRMRHDLEAALEEAEALATSLERQADQFGETMERAAAGDLTERLDADVDNDAMERIAAASNEMLAELEATVERVQRFAREVDDSSDGIAASVADVERASEEVSEAVRDIAVGAERQDDSIRTAADEMTDLSAAIEEVAASADEVAETVDEAAEIGETGSEHAAAALEELDAIESTAETAIEEVERLTDEMAEIVAVVDLVGDIAEQTNVLALNASIEAARAGQVADAGDVGDGFGVVAGEVKSLAEEAREATDEIERRIEGVQSSTEATADDMREMGRRVDEGIDTVGDAIGALEEIVERVRAANDGVRSISEATDDQAASTEEVVAMMEDVGDVSEETTETADDVAAVAEEQTSSTAEVSADVSELSRRANELRALVEQFDTAADAATDAGTDAGPVATDGAGGNATDGTGGDAR